MNVLAELRRRFTAALSPLVDGGDVRELVDAVRVSQDPKFGEYQANCAMPLGKRLKRNPREVAQEIIARLDIADLCHPPEIAGPGFINLRLKESWLAERLHAAVTDPRLTIEPVAEPRTYVIDYSAPNVAKPMHVGHIRSTVIGDSLYRTLKFLGHRVIGDNHLGDWGTQFGMIIFGYKHFLDADAYRRAPVDELARLYRLVNQLVDFHDSQQRIGPLIDQMGRNKEQLAAAVLSAQSAQLENGHAEAKKKEVEKTVRRIEENLTKTKDALLELQAKLEKMQGQAGLLDLAEQHPDIGEAVLAETAKLHQGDPENLRLWREFMPPCLEAIQVIYRRLGVTFDVTLGESFYHDRLAATVDDLRRRGLAKESEGALVVFVEGSSVPMIVQKKDGAFLYATTDLATIKYRMETWQPNAILYVVDHRQSLHFEHLFAVARLWGCENVEFQHVSFGTVLGEDGRPYKTRSGDTVGLMGLLDEAVDRALEVVSANDDQMPGGPQLSPAERQRIAEAVGISAIKYADLAHNRTSDYTFSYQKMLAMNGNTATYMQYAYARVRSIFRKGEVDVESLRKSAARIQLDAPAERGLAILLLRFAEALADTAADYRPNHLTDYLFTLANAFSTFFEQCPVLKAESPELRNSRLLLCDLTARTLKQGLELLGITVVEKM
jgi:arginyl-tRNA synthetase